MEEMMTFSPTLLVLSWSLTSTIPDNESYYPKVQSDTVTYIPVILMLQNQMLAVHV